MHNDSTDFQIEKLFSFRKHLTADIMKLVQYIQSIFINIVVDVLFHSELVQIEAVNREQFLVLEFGESFLNIS